MMLYVHTSVKIPLGQFSLFLPSAEQVMLPGQILLIDDMCQVLPLS